MNLLTTKAISISLIALLSMGVFAVPTKTQAAWGDILGIFGIGGSGTSSSGSQNSYDYNSTSSNSSGDIKMSKQVRQIGNSKYHEKITVRSGAAVEVWIEVKNNSSRHSADTVIRDEMGGSSVYINNSLRVNGQSSQPGLTSSGLRVNIPPKGKVIITYQMNVCNSTSYPMRAYASAPSLGAATDAIIVYTETFNVGYFDETSSCMARFQASNNPVSTSSGSISSNNPFGTWTGVQSGSSSSSTNSNNAFGTWTGVQSGSAGSNASASSNNPFGTWTGVQSSTAGNPFGDWTGVQSGSMNTSSTASSNNPFGTWTGVQSSAAGNPFGDWTGVQNSGAQTDAQYDMGGYSTSANSNTNGSVNRAIAFENADANQTQTYFVAPTTGVSKSAPFIFAGLLTAGFMAFRKRKLLFT